MSVGCLRWQVMFTDRPGKENKPALWGDRKYGIQSHFQTNVRGLASDAFRHVLFLIIWKLEKYLSSFFSVFTILIVESRSPLTSIHESCFHCFLYSEPCLRKCLSVPPLSSECGPSQKDIPPALSSVELHSNYWEIPKSAFSASHQSHPAIDPSSPQDVCFFVGIQDEP